MQQMSIVHAHCTDRLGDEESKELDPDAAQSFSFSRWRPSSLLFELVGDKALTPEQAKTKASAVQGNEGGDQKSSQAKTRSWSVIACPCDQC
jgi:hypothetical protein